MQDETPIHENLRSKNLLCTLLDLTLRIQVLTNSIYATTAPLYLTLETILESGRMSTLAKGGRQDPDPNREATSVYGSGVFIASMSLFGHDDTASVLPQLYILCLSLQVLEPDLGADISIS